MLDKVQGRGNPGYGKMEFIRTNVEKFSPKFWELMEIYANSRNIEQEKIFIVEFNKIQAKMIPQLVGGDSENPIPVSILSGLKNVQLHNSDKEGPGDDQEDQGSTGRDIS